MAGLIHSVSYTGNATAPSDPLYEITSVSFDFGTHRRLAQGSDNWPVTWGADGHLYASWGDGGGFGGSNTTGRVSLGFGRFEGADPQTATGVNINGGVSPTSGNSSWPNSTGAGSGKSYGIISLSGVLYAWIGPGSGNESFQVMQLYKSTDDGGTWSAVSGVSVNGTNATALNLIMPTILQMGQDYGLNEDGYVYSYWIGLKNSSGLVLQSPGEIYLSRVPVGSIETMAAYEWLTATTPTWGAVADRVPCFEHAGGIGWCMSGITYIEAVDLYVMCVQEDVVNAGNLSIYWARNPWGPWTQCFTTAAFGSGTLEDTLFGAYVAPKWQGALVGTSVDFVLLCSGIGSGLGMDSCNIVEGTFTVAEV